MAGNWWTGATSGQAPSLVGGKLELLSWGKSAAFWGQMTQASSINRCQKQAGFCKTRSGPNCVCGWKEMSVVDTSKESVKSVFSGSENDWLKCSAAVCVSAVLRNISPLHALNLGKTLDKL